MFIRPLQLLRLQQLPALPQVLQVQLVPVRLPQQRERFFAIMIMIGLVELFCIID